MDFLNFYYVETLPRGLYSSNVNGLCSVFPNHRREKLCDDWPNAEDTRLIGCRRRLNEDLVKRYGLSVFEVKQVKLALGGSDAFHRLDFLALLGHLVSNNTHFIGAPTVEAA